MKNLIILNFIGNMIHSLAKLVPGRTRHPTNRFQLLEAKSTPPATASLLVTHKRTTQRPFANEVDRVINRPIKGGRL